MFAREEIKGKINLQAMNRFKNKIPTDASLNTKACGCNILSFPLCQD